MMVRVRRSHDRLGECGRKEFNQVRARGVRFQVSLRHPRSEFEGELEVQGALKQNRLDADAPERVCVPLQGLGPTARQQDGAHRLRR